MAKKPATPTTKASTPKKITKKQISKKTKQAGKAKKPEDC